MSSKCNTCGTVPPPAPAKRFLGGKLSRKDLIVLISLSVIGIALFLALLLGAMIPAFQHNAAEELIFDVKILEALNYLDETDLLRSFWPEEWDALVYCSQKHVDTVALELINQGDLEAAYALYVDGNRTPPAYLEQAMQGSYAALLSYYNLKQFRLPNHVTTISETAFAGCTELELLHVPNTVTSIARGAFADCESLLVLYLPFVGESANATDNNYLGYLFGATSYEENANTVLPSLRAVRVTGETRIADNAFYGCAKLTEVALEEGVTAIGERAFMNCTDLLRVDATTSTERIGFGAFNGCSSLADLTLPFIGNTKDGTVNTHLGYIFGAETYETSGDFVPAALKRIVVLGGTKVADGAFYLCNDLLSVTLPDSVEYIGSFAFYGCGNLAQLSLPQDLTQIGESAFEGCSQLTAALP